MSNCKMCKKKLSQEAINGLCVACWNDYYCERV